MVEKIKQWILNFVSQHHASLEHIPCHFAKQALITNKINFIQTTTAGVKESHPHEVKITKEAPNYQITES